MFASLTYLTADTRLQATDDKPPRKLVWADRAERATVCLRLRVSPRAALTHMAASSAAAVDAPIVAVVEPLADDECDEFDDGDVLERLQKNLGPAFVFDDEGNIDVEGVLAAVPDDESMEVKGWLMKCPVSCVASTLSLLQNVCRACVLGRGGTSCRCSSNSCFSYSCCQASKG